METTLGAEFVKLSPSHYLMMDELIKALFVWCLGKWWEEVRVDIFNREVVVFT